MAFMVVAFLQTWDEADRTLLPSWPHLALALAMLMGGLGFAGAAWARLIERPVGRQAIVGFVVAQLGKYVPGAVWQAVGQIGHAVQSKVPAPRATVAFMVFALMQIASGGLIGALFGAVDWSAPTFIRVAALGGLGLLVLQHRATLVRVVSWISRRRGIDGSELVPSHMLIRRGLLLNTVAVSLVSLAFAVILAELSDVSILSAATAFAIAWTAGLLVVPVPAGLGIREAVLIATLGHAAAASALIAASALLRLGVLVAEGLVILLGALLPRSRSESIQPGEARTEMEKDPGLGQPLDDQGAAQ